VHFKSRVKNGTTGGKKTSSKPKKDARNTKTTSVIVEGTSRENQGHDENLQTSSLSADSGNEEKDDGIFTESQSSTQNPAADVENPQNSGGEDNKH